LTVFPHLNFTSQSNGLKIMFGVVVCPYIIKNQVLHIYIYHRFFYMWGHFMYLIWNFAFHLSLIWLFYHLRSSHHWGVIRSSQETKSCCFPHCQHNFFSNTGGRRISNQSCNSGLLCLIKHLSQPVSQHGNSDMDAESLVPILAHFQSLLQKTKNHRKKNSAI
jgi:hypothetical protein